ncbi:MULTISPECIES: poly-gamma-glutamate biosynthesis protein PgsC [Fusobacterium]|jgi:poly-gamma-glutamate biosynthesis protein PgsC/CapC|uniref:Poly-gamma-glutamate biosynthesis protein PgsC n=2 Tax=Fusobacterium ulcerans TaxID=861 RepID=A0AAX1TQM0_9FUSO|nr:MULTISPECIES: poly-gamma-glutamate biosynthesis protein PgsC [Fusobacterium]AVQ28414.1 poly-gamma-glutamate biosynthesis protein PgsC [Fusobacterium ulcerans]EFS25878.1 poly-gamma-glutamate biosynthesis protein PgsC [Fusobacterium ulcerans ATCC 49185]EHO78451.1 poly-gamma-glutamate biosynthesis protein PgsC [Fusobacterium ulcerans 12-1B]MDH6458918.1 poly-gamma-glutamate biosynthesis protein PgsC/CapC [Fusobacterium sp. PH5-7]RGY63413.1 poly-gamma-glutamate biosynthesis protein PgsC [Fusobac
MANDIIIFGIILSIIFYEITEISPGGLIVPAYIAFYINTPQRIIITIIAGILTFLIVKFISNHTIIYGRRKFALCIMISFMIRLILKYFNIYIVNEYEIYILGGSVIGVIIPGIMAQEMDRHGIVRTVSSLMILSIFIKAVVEVIYKAGGVN